MDPIRGTTGTGLLIGSPPLRSPEIVSSSYKNLRLLRLWVCGQRASVVQAQRHIHSLGAERITHAVAPHRHRRPVRQRLVRPPVIVEGQPFADPGSGFAAVGVAFEVDVLVFQGCAIAAR